MGDDEQPKLLEFPCSFPIKVLGRDRPGFRQLAVRLVERHAGKIDAAAVRVAPSRNGNFAAVTITIVATSQEQLDRIYQDLSDNDAVAMSL